MAALRWILLLSIALMSVAFSPARMTTRSSTQLSMKMDNTFLKAFAASAIGASLLVGSSAHAEIDYDGIKYLGGGDKIDLNNANIRSYLKLPGMYPAVASKIVTNGPYKAVGDVYNIPTLSGVEKDTLKKYEAKFVVLDEKPEYVVDKINNGLYR